ncbi:hypothetical protein [Methylomonas sp. UP202]|uniref:hypothetical protein n=1 Tax=Methylomonas sp. UP202 TaxID=3040943 RepID=UPI00247A538B|nr:hypothetical protein [Methylomonas sp. UP202]WGS84972.1 hypothetical protein QC632_18235 [Methylomonas sp. UP202]
MGAIGSIISDFAALLWQWLVYIPKFVAGILVGVLDSLKYYANLVLLKIVNPFFDLVVSILDGSGISSSITTINSAFSGSLGYWAGYFNIPTSISLIVAAYLLRFAIRRIPFIG